MDIPDNIQTCPAILAAVIAPANEILNTTYSGPQEHRALLGYTLGSMQHTTEPFIRLTAGDHTIVVQREPEVVIGVVVRTGDPIAKSLRRMLRRVTPPAKRIKVRAVRRAAPEAPAIGGGL